MKSFRVVSRERKSLELKLWLIRLIFQISTKKRNFKTSMKNSDKNKRECTLKIKKGKNQNGVISMKEFVKTSKRLRVLIRLLWYLSKLKKRKRENLRKRKESRLWLWIV